MSLELTLIELLKYLLFGVLCGVLAGVIQFIIEEIASKISYRAWRWLDDNDLIVNIILAITIWTIFFFLFLV